MNCTYHPVYRECRSCGLAMRRGEVRECSGVAALVEKAFASDRLTLAELAELEQLAVTVPAGPWREDCCKKHDLSDARDDGLACYGVWEGDMKLDYARVARFTAAARNAQPALIGMARRLLEVESALEFLDEEADARIVTDYRAPGESDSAVSLDSVIARAKRLGWNGLTP